MGGHSDFVICNLCFGGIHSHHFLAVFESWTGVGAVSAKVTGVEYMALVASQVLPEECFLVFGEWFEWCGVWGGGNVGSTVNVRDGGVT